MFETGGDNFTIDFPAEVFAKSEGSKRCVKGFASTEVLDQQSETVLQKGLDFSYLRDHGFINYDHQRVVIAGAEVPIIIGHPTLVEMRPGGLWCEGELLTGDPMASEQIRLANEMWQLGQSLQKSGTRRLAYSAEGKVLERRGKKVVRAKVENAALTHKPVNTSCSVELFAKSLCCGRCSPDHPEYNPAHRCHNKDDAEFPEPEAFLKALEAAMSTASAPDLLTENLDRGVTSVLYGDQDCGCFERKTGRFHKGLGGAVGHLATCRGHGKDRSIQFLQKLVKAAETDAWVHGLTRAAFGQ